jgi:Fungal Zn(2)-Cys(6) binuclear cluster domain
MATPEEAALRADAPAQSVAHPEIDEILRRKRKTREQRACYPCRQRKVKCDYQTPCLKCADRGHPELCSYQLPSKRLNSVSITETIPPKSDPTKPAGPEWNWISTKIDNIEQSLEELKSDIRHLVASGGKLPPVGGNAKDLITNVEDPNAQGIHTDDDFTGQRVHLGGNSVPAMVIALGRGSDEEAMRELLGKSILPLFGLDNQSATYPFVDLWGLPYGSSTRIDELCRLLPADADCLQYFQQYRDTAHVLYPGVVDINQFESDLTHFLINRANRAANMDAESLTEQNIYGMNLHWIGLLFATLASGCQCSGTPRKERQLTSQVYGKERYECCSHEIESLYTNSVLRVRMLTHNKLSCPLDSG